VAQVLVVQQPADGQTSTNSNVAVRQETAIEPGSIIAGYASPPKYTVSRYDEDYSYLENPANRIELLDSIKYIPLFGGGPDCYLSLGGELREQYEFIQNDNFGLGSVNDSGYWLQRLMCIATGTSDRLSALLFSSNPNWRKAGSQDPGLLTEKGLTSTRPLSISVIRVQTRPAIRPPSP